MGSLVNINWNDLDSVIDYALSRQGDWVVILNKRKHQYDLVRPDDPIFNDAIGHEVMWDKRDHLAKEKDEWERWQLQQQTQPQPVHRDADTNYLLKRRIRDSAKSITQQSNPNRNQARPPIDLSGALAHDPNQQVKALGDPTTCVHSMDLIDDDWQHPDGRTLWLWVCANCGQHLIKDPS